MQNLFTTINPLLMLSSVGSLIIFAFIYYAYQSFTDTKSRSEVKKRLSVKKARLSIAENPGAKIGDGRGGKKLTNKVAKKANDFYASSDPKSLRKLQLQLIQAGYMSPGAVGKFLAARAVAGVLFAGIGVLLVLLVYVDLPAANKLLVVLLLGCKGYFLPTFFLKRRTAKIESENRQGFPDVMDLMVVAAEAGLTMEASIERIAKELELTYPNLSMQLNMASLEIRAGRPIDQALRAFGERLRLEEVQGFSTMIQQSKELGTSVSDALRVYSDEMRHKRMMKAEEKAYALPAKMSVPVTVFILPIVIGIAIIPTIVRLSVGDY